VTASESGDQTLVCEGSIDREGYPYGNAPTRPATVLVVLNKDPALTKAVVANTAIRVTVNGKAVDSLGNPQTICRPSKTPFERCIAHRDGDILKITNANPRTTTSLELDLSTGKFATASDRVILVLPSRLPNSVSA
jgi:hypothetical protein